MLSVAAVAALTSFATAANATTVTGNQAVFIQTSDDSSGGTVGNIGAKNTIVVTDKGGGTLDIAVDLASGWGIVNTGASGSGGSITFGLTGITSLNFGAV